MKEWHNINLSIHKNLSTNASRKWKNLHFQLVASHRANLLCVFSVVCVHINLDGSNSIEYFQFSPGILNKEISPLNHKIFFGQQLIIILHNWRLMQHNGPTLDQMNFCGWAERKDSTWRWTRIENFQWSGSWIDLGV